MGAVTLAVSGLLGLTSAVLYVHVGELMRQKAAHAPERLALLSFATWWFSLGAYSTLTALQLLLAAGGLLDAVAFRTLQLVSILPLALALAALLYYLVYLQVGRAWVLWPIVGGYAVVYVFFVFVVVHLHVESVRVDAWAVHAQYARPFEGGLLWSTLLVLLAPPLVAAALYGSLIFRVDDRRLRIRMALVSGSLLLWLGAFPLLGRALRLHELEVWPLVTRLVAILVPLLIVAAYHPPPRLAAWMAGRPGAADALRP